MGLVPSSCRFSAWLALLTVIFFVQISSTTLLSLDSACASSRGSLEQILSLYKETRVQRPLNGDDRIVLSSLQPLYYDCAEAILDAEHEPSDSIALLSATAALATMLDEDDIVASLLYHLLQRYGGANVETVNAWDLSLARLLEKRSRYSDAIRHYERIARRAPLSVDVALDYSASLKTLGKGGDANAWLREILNAQNDSVRPAFSLARNLIDAGDLAQAQAVLFPRVRPNDPVRWGDPDTYAQAVSTAAWLALQKAQPVDALQLLAKVEGAFLTVDSSVALLNARAYRIYAVQALSLHELGREKCLSRARLSAIHSHDNVGSKLNNSQGRRAIEGLSATTAQLGYLNVLDCVAWERLHDKKLLSTLLSHDTELYPKTFRVPEDIDQFQAYLTTKQKGVKGQGSALEDLLRIDKHPEVQQTKGSARDGLWIFKPQRSSGGIGIRIASAEDFLKRPELRSLPGILQRYIDEPYLIRQRKFHIRLYLMVTSTTPLRGYLFKGGLVVFCSKRFDTNRQMLSDPRVHISNIGRNYVDEALTVDSASTTLDAFRKARARSSLFSKRSANDEEDWSTSTSTWTLSQFLTFLDKNERVPTTKIDTLLNQFKLIAEKILNRIAEDAQACNLPGELPKVLGLDIQLDKSLKPWLLEVNRQPGLMSAAPAMADEKLRMIQSLWRTVELWNFDREGLADLLCLETDPKIMPSRLDQAIAEIDVFCGSESGATTCDFCALSPKFNTAGLSHADIGRLRQQRRWMAAILSLSSCETEAALDEGLLPLQIQGGKHNCQTQLLRRKIRCSVERASLY